MTTPHRLVGLWPGVWPYHQSEGVGLHLVGTPTDPDALIRGMAQHGCHPYAGLRIVQRLNASGEDRLTVQFALDFKAIRALMAEAGIAMTVIAPQPDWVPRSHDGAWPAEFLPQRFR